jgi:hypothetical protein
LDGCVYIIGACMYIFARPCYFGRVLASLYTFSTIALDSIGQDALFPFPRRHHQPFDAAESAALHTCGKHTQDDTREEQSTTANALPRTAYNPTTQRLRSAATDLCTATHSHDEGQGEASNRYLHHRAQPQHSRPTAGDGTPAIEEQMVPERDFWSRKF